MANPLIDRTPPAKLAASGQVVETQRELADFPRLLEAVENDLASLGADKAPPEWRHAPIDIRLRFGWADVSRQIPALEGRVAATIHAVCQRCLEPFELSLDAQLRLMLLIPGREAMPFENYEIWETTEDTVRPLDIVDEALIMAMPLSAAHEDARNCGPLARKLQIRETGKNRPFADLRSQMRDTHR